MWLKLDDLSYAWILPLDEQVDPIMADKPEVCVYLGPALASYNFGDDHPYGPKRHDAFSKALGRQSWSERAGRHAPVQASQAEIEKFHSHSYVELVKERSKTGYGYLDYGDTPAFKGVYEAAAHVVGSGLHATARVMAGEIKRAFIPIAGLHHAARDHASGFCVFNDCGVIIETLLQDFKLKRVAYVDIDAHHGDGVFYAFETDPRVIIADLHQDGRTLYPGTGFVHETGKDEARGTKLNIPMQPGADDSQFMEAWNRVETHLQQHPPEFIVLQSGADSLAGDPITDLRYSSLAYAHAARRLRALADEHCQGKLIALGGGGYNLNNVVTGWVAVVEALA
jgi:acetoin utilization protein AcuC